MNDQQLPSRYDRTGLYMYIAFGAGAVLVTLWQMVTRLLEVAPGRDIPVTVPLEQAAALPMGPGGTAVEVGVREAVVTVADPAPATLFALWAHPIATSLAIVAGIVVGVLFCLRIARGRAFQTGTYLLVYLGVGILAAGWFLGWLTGAMSANGAVASISDRGYDIPPYPTDWTPVFAIFALTAVALALQVGERMRRDTEGLV
jgi:hypothetical protein